MAAVLVVSSPLVKIRGFLRSWLGFLGSQSPAWAPALAVQGPASLLDPMGEKSESNETPSFLDNVFWMAVPKSRRTIERNIDLCPQCGSVKQKHVLCSRCYEKVKLETHAIRFEMRAQEGGPHRAPYTESVVLYEGEKPTEQDEGKRIIERNRKRPSWFTLD
uniref:Uncharacterized protein n=1 Tax=Sphaerodactylus townsendi TaxID=933632 RepID=A0ACB8FUB3_9SAUR